MRAKNLSVASLLSFRLENTIVLREWNNIDILLKVDDLIVVIENKIWSGERDQQLINYKKTVDKEFKNCRKVFIFLTPFGNDSSLNNEYINYSYKSILKILKLIIATYQKTMSKSVLVYIDDYIEILTTNIMNDGELNALAREVYLNHKDVLDLIYSNVPNPIHDLQNYLYGKLDSFGWVEKTSERTVLRFLPKELTSIIPNNGLAWGNEAFLFEFLISLDRIRFYFTIAPGDTETRNRLKFALSEMEVDEELDPSNTHFCFSRIDLILENISRISHDQIKLDNYFEDFWRDVRQAVVKAENLIITEFKNKV